MRCWRVTAIVVKAEESLQNLKVSLLQPGKYQPRTRMDKESLAELAESIKAQGVMQPILVRPVSPGKLRNHSRRAALAGSATGGTCAKCLR